MKVIKRLAKKVIIIVIVSFYLSFTNEGLI
jgi:hypothetical protein